MSYRAFPCKGGPLDGQRHYVKDNDTTFFAIPVGKGPIGWDVYVSNADHDPTEYEYAGFVVGSSSIPVHDLVAKVRVR